MITFDERTRSVVRINIKWNARDVAVSQSVRYTTRESDL